MKPRLTKSAWRPVTGWVRTVADPPAPSADGDHRRGMAGKLRELAPWGIPASKSGASLNAEGTLSGIFPLKWPGARRARRQPGMFFYYHIHCAGRGPRARLFNFRKGTVSTSDADTASLKTKCERAPSAALLYT